MTTMTLGLIVVYVSDMQRSTEFYEMLGMAFQDEKHGSGPVHVSTELGDTVLELYPQGGREASRIRLGLRVDDVAAILASVATIKPDGDSVAATMPYCRGTELVAVVQDPDGNKVELVQACASPPDRDDLPGRGAAPM